MEYTPSISVSLSKQAELLFFLALAFIYVLIISIQPSLLVYVAIIIPILLYGAVLVFFMPKTLLVLSTIVGIFVVNNAPGLDIGEVIYYLMISLTFVFLLIPQVLSGQIRIESQLDKLFLFFCFFLIWGICTGMLYTRSLSKPIIEFLYFYSPVILFFPLKKYFHHENFRKLILLAVSIIFLYVIINTYSSYRTALLSAVAEWEFNFVRGAGNENFLLIGSISLLIALGYSRQKLTTLFTLATLMLSLGATVLTLTRSLWVVTLLGFAIVYLLVDKKQKIFFLKNLGAVVFIVILIALLYMDFTRFFLDVLAFRFQSFGAGTLDLSLMDRVVETKAVLSEIIKNPIVGHGLGSEYERYSILFRFVTFSSFYVHNGYLAILYKLGLFGLVFILSYCIVLFKYSYQLFKISENLGDRIIGLTMVAYLPSAGLMNLTSPVFLTWEGIFILTVSGSYLSWRWVSKQSKVAI